MRVHEARDLHDSNSGVDQTFSEFDPDFRGKDVGLVLKTVPWPDLDDGYAPLVGHASTLAPPL